MQLLHTLVDLSTAYRTDTDPSTDRVGTDPSTDGVGIDASSLGGGSTIDASSLGAGAAVMRRRAPCRAWAACVRHGVLPSLEALTQLDGDAARAARPGSGGPASGGAARGSGGAARAARLGLEMPELHGLAAALGRSQLQQSPPRGGAV